MVQLEPMRTAASAGSASATGTQALARSNRSRARSLNRILSGQHLDDHSHYHHHEFDGDKDDLSDSEHTLNDNEKDLEDLVDQDGDVHETTANEQDLEAGGARLEKKKTSRSVKDRNLVG